MKHAIINSDGLVVNVIELEDGVEWTPPEGMENIQSDTAEIGWSYAGGIFTAPVIMPPTKTVEEQKTELLSNIAYLESSNIMPRSLRDIILKDSTSAAYANTKTLDDQITALRTQIKALPAS